MKNKNENFIKSIVVISQLYSTFIILFAYGFFSDVSSFFKITPFIMIFGYIGMSIVFYFFVSWPWLAIYRLARSKSNEVRIMVFIFLTVIFSSYLFVGKSYSSDNANGFVFVMFSWILYPATYLFAGEKKIKK